MSPWQRDVWHFHKASGTPTPEDVTPMNSDQCKRRSRLIEEEAKETISALKAFAKLSDSSSWGAISSQTAEVLDGLVDLVVVCLGTAVEMGVDLEPVWREVHCSNMNKFPFPKNKWGKVLKPDGWKGPVIPIERQGY